SKLLRRQPLGFVSKEPGSWRRQIRKGGSAVVRPCRALPQTGQRTAVLQIVQIDRSVSVGREHSQAGCPQRGGQLVEIVSGDYGQVEEGSSRGTHGLGVVDIHA